MPRWCVRTAAAQRERQLVVEKILKNQPNLRGTAELIQQFDDFRLWGEVGVLNRRVAARREAITFENIRRQRIGNVARRN